MNRFNVRKVAVLGAGVMGAQIAAHLVNVKVPVVLFDLPAKEGPKNGIVTKAVEGLKKLKPAPLGVPEDAALIEQANYEEHLDQLKDCDLIIEAIAERMDWKLDLYTKIAPAHRAARDRREQHLGPVDHQAVRGAARRDQAALLRHPLLQPAALHGAGRADRHADHRAGGPRPARGLRDHRARQGRGARQGHAELHRQPRRHRRHAGDDEGGRDLRPRATTSSTTSPARSSAAPARGTFRTADVVGLDTMAHVIKTLQDNLARTTRSIASFATPAVLQKLIDAGALGQKTRRRLLQEGRQGHPAPRRREGRLRARRRQGRRDRRPHPEEAAGRAPEAAARIEEPAGAVPLGDPARQLPLRRRAPGRRSPRARATSTSRCAGASAPAQGPFELWQEAGWTQVAQWVKEDIDAGKALSKRAAAGVGVRGPGRRRRRRAPPEGSWSAGACPLRSAEHAAGLPAPAVPRERVRRRRAGAAEGRHRGVQERRGPRLDARRRGADRQHHRQAAPDQPERDRGPAEGASSSPRRATRAW